MNEKEKESEGLIALYIFVAITIYRFTRAPVSLVQGARILHFFPAFLCLSSLVDKSATLLLALFSLFLFIYNI